jgi:hypothetical protein
MTVEVANLLLRPPGTCRLPGGGKGMLNVIFFFFFFFVQVFSAAVRSAAAEKYFLGGKFAHLSEERLPKTDYMSGVDISNSLPL